MVRVGGGWVALDEFLVKNDPCRGELDILKQFFSFDGRLKFIEECIKRCQEKDKKLFNPLKPKSTEGKWSFNSNKIKTKRKQMWMDLQEKLIRANLPQFINKLNARLEQGKSFS